ncbi:MAG: Mut7-C ubiquitin/RNAse domain-containing protein [Calditrichaceae bacterium]|nr:Mut7-C ubiquitin/RNAse domain-containing protein [Calditrichia bacterium]NUQ39955.1 Mut7-C ubiquitin/RNAse domain-containing protein [Calditrichaceae bacterium]
MKTKIARFRFYEELNDFLPPEKRKIAFDYLFKGRPGVKDAIEALGVPHPEVDMILVNGRPVDFSYLLQDGDRVAVYPVFEALDISGVTRLREKPLRNPRFILDVHLGKLARRLRLLGFDARYANHYSDREIIEIAAAEQRIILTRDRGLLKNKQVRRGYWLRSQQPREQLEEVLARFDLASLAQPFTRCLECNSEITAVEKEAIAGQLLPDTRKFYRQFYQCRGCGKIYWQGSHYRKMLAFAGEVVEVAKVKGKRKKVKG